MVGESLAIIAVILVMAAMIARRGKRGFFALTLPLIVVPVFHLIGWVFPPLGRRGIVMDIAGLLAGLALCVALSRSFRSRRSRLIYVLILSLFIIALTVAYLINLY